MSSGARYHVNQMTGRPNICRAKTACPFKDEQGNPAPHFDTKAEAQAHAEAELEQQYPDALASLRARLDPDETPAVDEAVVAENSDPNAALRNAMIDIPRKSHGPSEDDWKKFGVPVSIVVDQNSYEPRITFDNGIQTLTLEITGDCCSGSSLVSDPNFPEGVAIVSMSENYGDDYEQDGSYVKTTHYSFEMADGQRVEFDEENTSNGYYSSMVRWSVSPSLGDIDQWVNQKQNA